MREALFSALDARDLVRGATVADLYAGSGALGLEAASRGAKSVVLVDSSQKAAAICRSNAGIVTRAARTSLDIDIVARGVQSWLEYATGKFDLVFIDPPYDLGEDELSANLDALVSRLSADAVVIIERGSRSPEPRWPAGLEPGKKRVYGETTLWWAEAAWTEPVVD